MKSDLELGGARTRDEQNVQEDVVALIHLYHDSDEQKAIGHFEAFRNRHWSPDRDEHEVTRHASEEFHFLCRIADQLMQVNDFNAAVVCAPGPDGDQGPITTYFSELIARSQLSSWPAHILLSSLEAKLRRSQAAKRAALTRARRNVQKELAA